MTTQTFNAEVGRLLDIMANALYSEREIFIRELTANAADACEKRRFLALENGKLSAKEQPKITISVQDGKLIIADNGIGMNHQDLVDNLGTIARSGTKKFMESVQNKDTKDLIGQFGVGFYSAFMVANLIEVYSQKAGESQVYKWQSDGKSDFTITESDEKLSDGGTKIIVHLKTDANEFVDKFRVSSVVKRWSDYLPVPIFWHGLDNEIEQLNQAKSLWRMDPTTISNEDYLQFYKSSAMQFDEPFAVIHTRPEGIVNYQALLYVPTQQPHDLFTQPDMNRVKLYIKRMFITDNCKGIIPNYLRFISGVVECDDMPLNISREMLQLSPITAKIKQGLTKKILSELKKKLKDAPATYDLFYQKMGKVIKEGLYEQNGNFTKEIFELVRFAVNNNHDYIGLDDYIDAMKPNQNEIYYLPGHNEAALRASPHLEGFNARGIQVLLFTDPIDTFWVMNNGEYRDKKFVSILNAGIDLSGYERTDGKKPEDNSANSADINALIARMKNILGQSVNDIVVSANMTDSPLRLVASKDAPDIATQNLLRSMNPQSMDMMDFAPVMEINAHHALIKKLASQAVLDENQILLLFDAALVANGQTPKSEADFVSRIFKILS